jgi:hypothetical protein
MDDQFYEDLEYDFLTRAPSPGSAPIPDPIYRAIKDRLGNDFKPRLVHPIGDKPFAHLFVAKTGEAIRATYEEPATTKFDFLGDLAGGSYSEIVEATDQGLKVEGVFTHERAGEPIRVMLDPSGSPRGHLYPEEQRAIRASS